MSLLKRALKRADRLVVLSAGVVLITLIAVCAVLSWWAAALIALSLLNLVVLAVGLHIVPFQGVRPTQTTPSAAAVSDLERRVELLSSRAITSTERARVEILDALADRRHESGDTVP